MEKTLSAAKKSLDSKLAAADSISPIAREAKISADRAIALLHSGKRKEAEALIAKSKKGIERLDAAIAKDKTLYYSNFQITLAYQEYAEAVLLLSALEGKEFPDLQIPFDAYLLGLADVAGELNRAFLEARIRGDGKAANRFLSKAREIAKAFTEFDYPDFIVPSFRHKKDFVRGILNSMLSVTARENNNR